MNTFLKPFFNPAIEYEKFEISIDENWPIFNEHFPNNPILPGAFIFGILKTIFDFRLVGWKLQELEKLTYLGVLRPGMRVSYVYRVENVDALNKRVVLTMKNSEMKDMVRGTFKFTLAAGEKL